MRFFDVDKVGCYLDTIAHRLETVDDQEVKIVDLTLRVQPFTSELAVACDPDIHAALFLRGSGEPKPKVKALEFRLPVERQQLTVFLLPEADRAQIAFPEVEITRVRARTEKNVDGYALVFHARFGPPSAKDLEFVCAWHGQQRFLAFQPQNHELEFEAAPAPRARKPNGGEARPS